MHLVGQESYEYTEITPGHNFSSLTDSPLECMQSAAGLPLPERGPDAQVNRYKGVQEKLRSLFPCLEAVEVPGQTGPL